MIKNNYGFCLIFMYIMINFPYVFDSQNKAINIFLRFFKLIMSGKTKHSVLKIWTCQ